MAMVWMRPSFAPLEQAICPLNRRRKLCATGADWWMSELPGSNYPGRFFTRKSWKCGSRDHTGLDDTIRNMNGAELIIQLATFDGLNNVISKLACNSWHPVSLI